MDMHSASNITSRVYPNISDHHMVKYYASSILVLVATTLLAIRVLTKPISNVPLVNPPNFFEVTATRRKLHALTSARSLLSKAYEEFPNKCFRFMAEFAEVVVLPPEFANDIRNDERFDFTGFVRQLIPSQIYGLDAFRGGSHTLKAVVQRDLTKSLSKDYQPALTEWHTLTTRDMVLHLVARVSSRVFLGSELCRNEQWLRVTREYTVASFSSAEQMRLWPAPLRRIASYFHPGCRHAASLLKEARQCMEPVLERRKRERASGNYIPYNDAIEWFEAAAANGDEYDPVFAQLILSAAAIHTTTDLLCQVIGDLAQNPEFIEPLRQESIQSLSEGGWKKTTLYNMKLMDSCIKESQRMKPVSLLAMRRLVTEDVKLPDGTFIPKGSLSAVSSDRMWDATVYENPNKWDGARSFNKRKLEGQENAAQFVTTGPDHLAFGHGKHACPGRFFAANEIKILLVHILLKYDFKLHDRKPVTRRFGLTLGTDVSVKVDVRRRQEEIDLDSF
ncbi:hypothetical protein QQS21_008037 [Conoideocrella luteorostrata]|uniref:P450 monooxygenase n=1 Tax=Conoideocrella luteorostrata TaxID=1105319 RepID=A0AAJ0CLY6_9HYPO|nr:hypothetical protein QQS21_008037 [Conoideocrella luteorostrata]